jgi:hypothetical protein
MTENELLDEQHREWVKLQSALREQGDTQPVAGMTLGEIAAQAKLQNLEVSYAALLA